MYIYIHTYRYIYIFSLSLLFFLPFYTKTRRVALENKIDITCKNKAKMSGNANKAALDPPPLPPCKMACSIHPVPCFNSWRVFSKLYSREKEAATARFS